MAEKVILTRKQNRIGFITLNRPEAMNTFTPEFADQLDQALWDMEQDDEIMVVVVNAAGKHFCTGISLDQFNNKSHKQYREFLYGIDAFYHTLAKMTKTTIASVQGLALANGAGLAFACDLTVAADNSTFGTTAINVGLICLGPAAPMAKIIGRKKMLEMVLTGDMFPAAEAEALGLVNKVVTADELEQATLGLAEKLTKKSPIALRLGKEGLNRLLDGPYHQNLNGMDDLFASICATEDAEEGVRAFLEKRKPNWQEK
ncbi:MAG: enoyl-CoA hydratase/isomerase family protein [Desulfuromonadales bacterium]|nr:enoyl-CoA hydratase/isomerase family protein [Desulfuromonadales bacterium]